MAAISKQKRDEMKFLSNLHTHTRFSDGAGEPEEYVTAALTEGFVSIGFSDHSPTNWTGSGTLMEFDDYPRYLAEIGRLKEAYADKIEIYLGLEEDYWPPVDTTQLDYTIGSVHDLPAKSDGTMLAVDWHPGYYERLIEEYSGAEAMVTAYYAAVAQMIKQRRPTIVGHLDLITKLNRENCYFDPQSLWYSRASRLVAEAAAEEGLIVEVNTGAISRGYTEQPYPSLDLLHYLYKLGVPMTISSDCHSVEHLDCAFDLSVELLREAGYRSVKQMQKGIFVDIVI
ncbi:MAG: histidinol-phosphatase [Oscillospiraceae bacterium]